VPESVVTAVVTVLVAVAEGYVELVTYEAKFVLKFPPTTLLPSISGAM
jgi:hypothetical protein